ncbi:probable DNA (cytosine-5)-methyltransferase 3 [Coccomyxa sp. Obi]|nr:probable DNA (cytosine-5)-methyltransferase 3 [Coccomyxa sp. Obi]
MFSSATSKPSPKRRAALSLQGTKKRKIECLPTAVIEESDGITWDISTHIPQEEVRKRWPYRVLDGLPSLKSDEEVEDDCAPAVAHFEAVHVEDVGQVSLGDFVEVTPHEDEREDGDGLKHFYVVRVTELFQDTEGARWFQGKWMYKPWDTALRVQDGKESYMPGPIDKRRLFLASDHDNKGYVTLNTVGSIERKVKVKQIAPGAAPPPEEECDFWYDQEHDRRFFTFTDSLSAPPASKEHYQGLAGRRKLNVVELYCGCGGLSFIDRKNEDVHIETKWAVDMEPSMCAAFQANYPEAKVFEWGVDEWLALCKHFKRLSDKYPDDWEAPATADLEDSSDDEPSAADVYEVDAIISMTVHEVATRGTEGQMKGHLLESLNEKNSWIVFQVKWKGYDLCNTADEWVKEDDLACEAKLAEFVKKIRRHGVIPLPGDVDAVMGGPPCQGVSGLNRHAKRADIVNDPRNRQVQAFYDVIEWFNPGFVLMENVLDIFKKQDGMYAKFAASRLLNMRYQTRLGCIAACDQGAPQGRWRAFMWGAKAGVEQLPPFPEPSHFAAFQGGVPQSARSCVVTFKDEASRDHARPMVFLGDIFSDLPEITNFTTAEAANYASSPKTPYQLWMRRDPPDWQAIPAKRAEAADEAMAPSHADQNDKRRQLMLLPSPDEAVGRSFHCKKRGGDGLDGESRKNNNFAGETWQAVGGALQEEDPEEWEAIQLEQSMSQRALCADQGKKVLKEAEVAKSAAGPLRDHRSLCLNYDDYLRCCHVPSKKDANFRQMAGVVSHKNGTCCAGHTHAAVSVNGATACGGGGTRTQAPKGTTSKSRVDHHDRAGWRGGGLLGCEAETAFLPTGDLLCPRWCITYKHGKSSGRHGCFGRMWFDEIQPTVVGRAEPHNLRLIHPTQGRVVSIRENARCQGFPDYFVLAGISNQGQDTWVRNKCLTERYQQMGNAVCPLVADALGRCLALAARGKCPPSEFVLSVPSTEYEQCMEEAKELGLKSWVEENGLHPDTRKMLDRKKAEGLDFVLKQPVLDEKEEEMVIGDEDSG